MNCRREDSDACGGAGGKEGMSSEEPQFLTMLPSGKLHPTEVPAEDGKEMIPA